MINQRTLLGIFLAYLAFVVYGSLIPLDYHPLDLTAAVDRFSRIPWLDLGATSRADWVANLVLYIPLAFFGCSAFAGHARAAGPRLLLTMMVALLCLAIAVGVEFAQLFFAPRTVSLNDLLAETLGTLAGVTIWFTNRHRLVRLGQAFEAGGRQSVAASIAAYFILYLALALFPFDFVISLEELANKLHAGNTGWLLAPGTWDLLRGSASLTGEVMAIAPLGMLAGMLAGRVNLSRTLVFGMLFGLVLEVAQLFVWSSVSQGASVLARGVGLAGGAFVGQRVRAQGLLPLAQEVRRVVPLLLPFYLIALVTIAGWFTNSLLNTGEALAKFDTVQLLPFYFHYFTSEPVAMASLLANLAMYAPLGIAVWARHTAVPRGRRHGIWKAALSAVPIALLIESSKLWLAGEHPDFTNLLIGAAGAASSYALANWLARVGRQADETPEAPTPVAPTKSAPAPRSLSPRPALVPALASITAACVLVAGLWFHPLVLPLVLLLVVAYGFLLWRFPWAWLLLVPLLLPILDLAPYTGRLLLDEFDLLILATLVVGYWRNMAGSPGHWAGPGYREATVLLLISGLVATGQGLSPLFDGALLSLDSSHSALDALLIGKGLLWALLLIPLLRRISGDVMGQARQWLVAGLAAGLALLSLVVVWERHRFVGVGDFDGIFRVTGNFSTMNNGGAYIEAFIATSFPALAVWTLQQKSLILRLCALAAGALASYAMLVTFSRAGYAGLGAGLAVVALTLRPRPDSRGLRHGLWLIGFVAAVVAAATPVLLGTFAPSRLAQAQKDLTVRMDHWRHALDLMDPGLGSMLTGMGFGRYPARYLWQADTDRPPGTYAVRHEHDGSYLRLGAGDAYYLDQILDIDTAESHNLAARLRFHDGEESLDVFLCEKALLYSFRCNRHVLARPAQAEPGQWQLLTVPLDTAGLGHTGRWPARTLKLSIATPAGGGAVDVDHISLRDSHSQERLHNGDFVNGLAHWLSATDRDLAWHIHQSALEVYFAQGLLGLAAILATLLAAANTLIPRMRRGEPFAIAIGGGLVGFLTVGLLGSTMDAARTAFLFYLLLFTAGTLSRGSSSVQSMARDPGARALKRPVTAYSR